MNDVRAVIFDWAGTTVDFGSRAPARVFTEIFRRRGVDLTLAEAREPMGRAKRDHIAAILAMPRVAAAWHDVHGAPATDVDVESMYGEFLPLQKEALLHHADVIPGVPEVMAELRRRGIRIGSTTGYTRELMEVLRPAAAAAGFAPDNVICADDVAAGRPAPWLLFRSAEQLGIYPMSAIVVVDDTQVGIQAARHAGGVAVGVTRSGNCFGLSAKELAALPGTELQCREEEARRRLLSAGAHHVIASVAELPTVLD